MRKAFKTDAHRVLEAFREQGEQPGAGPSSLAGGASRRRGLRGWRTSPTD